MKLSPTARRKIYSRTALTIGLASAFLACSSGGVEPPPLGGLESGGSIGGADNSGDGTTASGSTTSAGSGSSSGDFVAAGGSEPVVEPGRALDERVEVFDLPLSGTANNGSTINNTVFPAARPGGGLTLGWNEGDVGHLMRVNADLEAEGVEWDLPGLMIVRTLGLPDDGVAVLVIDHTSSMTNSFSTDRHLRLFIYDAAGKKTRETSIIGGTGIGVGSSWFAWGSRRSAAMAVNDGRISIYSQVSDHRTASSGVHQGDLFIEVDAEGKLDESTRAFWRASHSTLPHLVLGESGEGLRLTVGDSNPFGLEYQTDDKYGDVVVWPPEDQLEAGKEGGDSSVSAGDLCGLQYRAGRLYATVASGRTQPFSPSKDYGDVVLLSWDSDIEEEGDVDVTWLTNTPSTAEVCPTLTALGNDHQLSAWGAKDDSTATLALLDAQGKLVSGPTASTAPFNKNSQAVALAGGDVAWTYADRNATSVKVSVVRAD